MKNKKCFGVMLLLLLSQIALPQEKFAVEVFAKPQVTRFQGKSVIVGVETKKNTFERTFSYGLFAGYELLKRTRVLTGIVSEKYHGTSTIETEYGVFIKVEYVKVPLLFCYDIISKEKFSTRLGIGIGSNFCRKVEDIFYPVVYDGTRFSDIERYKRVVLDAMARVGMQYKITRSISLGLNLNFSNGINKFHKKRDYAAYDIGYKFQSFGVDVGCAYAF